MRRRIFAVLLVFYLFVFSAFGGRNVILMISDGAGFNAFHCANYYNAGDKMPYPLNYFPVVLGCTTYSLGDSGDEIGYDSEKYWSDFGYMSAGYTDSAAAATALATGRKTINGRVGVDKNGKKLTNIVEIAKSFGKKAGVLSSVEISHATPAGFVAHNISRNNYAQIAEEMVMDSEVDLLMGAGHPYYDNDGRNVRLPLGGGNYVGGMNVFNKLEKGTTGRGWIYFDKYRYFDTIARAPEVPFERIIGLARVNQTLHYKREQGRGFNRGVPSLELMTRAALNFLGGGEGGDDDGFFLMVEGGAVDWANHDNNLGRMIEEQKDFVDSVGAAIQWIEANSSWKETLLIVTSDHECGKIWGLRVEEVLAAKADSAGGDAVAVEDGCVYELPINNGKGTLPSASYYSGSHTNSLVPLFALGAGSEMFDELVDGVDQRAGHCWGFSGEYVDNTDIFTVMKSVIEGD